MAKKLPTFARHSGLNRAEAFRIAAEAKRLAQMTFPKDSSNKGLTNSQYDQIVKRAEHNIRTGWGGSGRKTSVTHTKFEEKVAKEARKLVEEFKVRRQVKVGKTVRYISTQRTSRVHGALPTIQRTLDPGGSVPAGKTAKPRFQLGMKKAEKNTVSAAEAQRMALDGAAREMHIRALEATSKDPSVSAADRSLTWGKARKMRNTGSQRVAHHDFHDKEVFPNRRKGKVYKPRQRMAGQHIAPGSPEQKPYFLPPPQRYSEWSRPALAAMYVARALAKDAGRAEPTNLDLLEAHDAVMAHEKYARKQTRGSITPHGRRGGVDIQKGVLAGMDRKTRRHYGEQGRIFFQEHGIFKVGRDKAGKRINVRIGDLPSYVRHVSRKGDGSHRRMAGFNEDVLMVRLAHTATTTDSLETVLYHMRRVGEERKLKGPIQRVHLEDLAESMLHSIDRVAKDPKLMRQLGMQAEHLFGSDGQGGLRAKLLHQIKEAEHLSSTPERRRSYAEAFGGHATPGVDAKAAALKRMRASLHVHTRGPTERISAPKTFAVKTISVFSPAFESGFRHMYAGKKVPDFRGRMHEIDVDQELRELRRGALVSGRDFPLGHVPRDPILDQALRTIGFRKNPRELTVEEVMDMAGYSEHSRDLPAPLSRALAHGKAFHIPQFGEAHVSEERMLHLTKAGQIVSGNAEVQHTLLKGAFPVHGHHDSGEHAAPAISAGRRSLPTGPQPGISDRTGNPIEHMSAKTRGEILLLTSGELARRAIKRASGPPVNPKLYVKGMMRSLPARMAKQGIRVPLGSKMAPPAQPFINKALYGRLQSGIGLSRQSFPQLGKALSAGGGDVFANDLRRMGFESLEPEVSEQVYSAGEFVVRLTDISTMRKAEAQLPKILADTADLMTAGMYQAAMEVVARRGIEPRWLPNAPWTRMRKGADQPGVETGGLIEGLKVMKDTAGNVGTAKDPLQISASRQLGWDETPHPQNMRQTSDGRDASDEKYTMAELAALNEFGGYHGRKADGTPTYIPSRPWLSRAADLFGPRLLDQAGQYVYARLKRFGIPSDFTPRTQPGGMAQQVRGVRGGLSGGGKGNYVYKSMRDTPAAPLGGLGTVFSDLPLKTSDAEPFMPADMTPVQWTDR